MRGTDRLPAEKNDPDFQRLPEGDLRRQFRDGELRAVHGADRAHPEELARRVHAAAAAGVLRAAVHREPAAAARTEPAGPQQVPAVPVPADGAEPHNPRGRPRGLLRVQHRHLQSQEG